MTVLELKIECAERGLDVDKRLKRKELQQNLKDHLKGVQRVPALLINEQDKSLKDINLGTEIMLFTNYSMYFLFVIKNERGNRKWHQSAVVFNIHPKNMCLLLPQNCTVLLPLLRTNTS